MVKLMSPERKGDTLVSPAFRLYKKQSS